MSTAKRKNPFQRGVSYRGQGGGKGKGKRLSGLTSKQRKRIRKKII